MYKTIAIYGTHLQKKIINHLIDEEIISKNGLLVIDGSRKQVKVNDTVIGLNFNVFSKVLTSIRNIKKLRELDLECETLISTHFTGINALFFSSFIKCQEKILIDDGIGTPVLLLDNKVYNRLVRFQVRFSIIRLILFLFYDTKLTTVQKATQNFTKYYSIYNFKKLFSDKPFEFRYIDGVNKKFEILPENVGFIGSPMVDFGLVSKMKFKQLLSEIIDGEGPLTYFLHPNEKKANHFEMEGITFVRPQTSIEEYFEKNGVPETLFSFSSSATLNVASANPDVKIFNINFKSFFRNKSHVYNKVLDEFSILESTYTVQNNPN